MALTGNNHPLRTVSARKKLILDKNESLDVADDCGDFRVGLKLVKRAKFIGVEYGIRFLR